MLGLKPACLAAFGKCIPFEILVLQQPVAAVEHLLRVGGGGKNLRQQLIGVESDGRHQIVDADLRWRRSSGAA